MPQAEAPDSNQECLKISPSWDLFSPLPAGSSELDRLATGENAPTSGRASDILVLQRISAFFQSSVAISEADFVLSCTKVISFLQLVNPQDIVVEMLVDLTEYAVITFIARIMPLILDGINNSPTSNYQPTSPNIIITLLGLVDILVDAKEDFVLQSVRAAAIHQLLWDNKEIPRLFSLYCTLSPTFPSTIPIRALSQSMSFDYRPLPDSTSSSPSPNLRYPVLAESPSSLYLQKPPSPSLSVLTNFTSPPLHAVDLPAPPQTSSPRELTSHSVLNNRMRSEDLFSSGSASLTGPIIAIPTPFFSTSCLDTALSPLFSPNPDAFTVELEQKPTSLVAPDGLSTPVTSISQSLFSSASLLDDPLYNALGIGCIPTQKICRSQGVSTTRPKSAGSLPGTSPLPDRSQTRLESSSPLSSPPETTDDSPSAPVDKAIKVNEEAQPRRPRPTRQIRSTSNILPVSQARQTRAQARALSVAIASTSRGSSKPRSIKPKPNKEQSLPSLTLEKTSKTQTILASVDKENQVCH